MYIPQKGDLLGDIYEGIFIPRYFLERRLKTGGQTSRLWIAHDHKTDSEVVAKLPDVFEGDDSVDKSDFVLDLANQRSFIDQAKTEIGLARKFKHNNIAFCIDYATTKENIPAVILENLGEPSMTLGYLAENLYRLAKESILSVKEGDVDRFLRNHQKAKDFYAENRYYQRLYSRLETPTLRKLEDNSRDLLSKIASMSRSATLSRSLSEEFIGAGGPSMYYRLDPVNQYVVTCGRVINDLFSAIDHVYSKEFCHNDLHMSNIIIDENRGVQVIDFGLATGKGQAPIFGTRAYCPPDRFFWDKVDNVALKDYKCSTDFWNVALIISQILTGNNPLGEDRCAILSEFKTRLPDSERSRIRLQKIQSMTEEYVDSRWVDVWPPGYQSPLWWLKKSTERYCSGPIVNIESVIDGLDGSTSRVRELRDSALTSENSDKKVHERKGLGSQPKRKTLQEKITDEDISDEERRKRDPHPCYSPGPGGGFSMWELLKVLLSMWKR